MTNLEWVRTLSAKELAELMSGEIHKVALAYTDSLGAIELWLSGERTECQIKDCVLKNSKSCNVCWGSTLCKTDSEVFNI